MDHFRLFPDGYLWKLTSGRANEHIETFVSKDAAILALAQFLGRRRGSLKIFQHGGVFEEERMFPATETEP